jgi:hypothetical protein
MASGHLRAPHSKAGQMAAPTSMHYRPESPCQQGAVHRWLIFPVLAMPAARLVWPQLRTFHQKCLIHP